MNNIQYNILFLLTAMPYISLTMNDPRQGRSLDNTRRLLLGDSVSKPTFSEGKKGSLLVLMSELPPMPNEQEKKRVKKTKDPLSRAPLYSKPVYFIQKEAPNKLYPLLAPIAEEPKISVKKSISRPKQLHNQTKQIDANMAKFNALQELQVKFEKGIASDDVLGTIKLLYNNELRSVSSLAKDLYDVMTKRRSSLYICPADAEIIPLSSICNMAKSVATFGDNKMFLAKYQRIKQNSTIENS